MPSSVAITYKTITQRETAERLAQRLNLPLVEESTINSDYLLMVTPERLELHKNALPKQKPFYIDFLSDAMAYRRVKGGGRQQLLARAVGIKSGVRPTILDITAGLGRDGFVLACLGCEVTLLERSPIMGTLLADGLQRARQENDLQQLKIHFYLTDAMRYLASLSVNDYPDVIYFDPMYPERNKSALVKKELRIIREIVGDDEDAPHVLQRALQCAKQRVVVKRPLHAPTINELKPDIIYKGKTSRFDAYLTNRQYNH